MRILIADQQTKVRYAISVLIQRQPGWCLAAEAVNAADLLAKTLIQRPDVIMMDWDLPGQPAHCLVSAIRQALPESIIILLSARPEQKTYALSLGVDFFISKVDSPDTMLEILQDCQARLSHSVI